AEVVEGVAVEIDECDAAGRSRKGADSQMLAHEAAVLERHPVSLSERKVGDGVCDLSGLPVSFAKARLIKGRQPHETIPAQRNDVGRGVVGAEEATFAVVVERHQSGYSPRYSRMTGKRGGFRPRQLQAASEHDKRGRDRPGANPVKCQCSAAYVHHSSAQ